MCRAKHEGGRRCPNSGYSCSRANMAARKRLSRARRAVQVAEAAGDPVALKTASARLLAAQDLVADSQRSPRGDVTSGRPGQVNVPDGEPVDVRRMLGESAYTDVLTYADGTRVVRKDYSRQRYSGEDDIAAYSDAEELAPFVLRACGLRAAAVSRTGEHEIHMEYVDGQRGDEIGASTGFERDISPDLVGSRDGRALGLADHLMQHTDRESGENVIQDKAGRLVGVDNGDSFRHGFTHSVFAQSLYSPASGQNGQPSWPPATTSARRTWPPLSVDCRRCVQSSSAGAAGPGTRR